jgi:hypothetical protein
LTLHSSNNRIAYRDVLYRTNYLDKDGRLVAQRADYIKDIFQPGTAVDLEVIDGFLPTQYASATIELLAAEALVPVE